MSRAPFAALALAPLLVLGACSSKSDSPTAQPSPSTTPLASIDASHLALTAAQADAALIVPADLTPDYKIDSRGVAEHADDEVGCAAFDTLHLGDLKAKMIAAINLSRGDTGPFVTEEISIRSTAEAQAVMAKFVSAVAACSSFTSKGANGDIKWTGTALPVTAPGIEAGAGLRAQGKVDGKPSAFDLTLSQIGGVLVFVTEGRVNGESPTTESLVAKAIAKVRVASTS